MKPFGLVGTLLGPALFASCLQAQLVPFFKRPSTVGPAPKVLVKQDPMSNNMPGIQLPPVKGGQSNMTPTSGTVVLSDVIGNLNSIRLFAQYTRDFTSISSRLDSTSLNTTVLAPLDSAMRALPRKPWEDPEEYNTLGANAYEGPSGEERATANIRRFAESHIVPANPWREGEKLSTMTGNTVWWENKNGKVLIQPGNIEVDAIVKRVANGEVWALKGVVDYARAR